MKKIFLILTLIIAGVFFSCNTPEMEGLVSKAPSGDKPDHYVPIKEGNTRINATSTDRYEHNDVPEDAGSIAIGTSQAHNFYDDHEDWIKFTAPVPAIYTIKTWCWEDADTVVYLYEDGNFNSAIASNDDKDSYDRASKITTVLSAGIYYLKVKSYGGRTGAGNAYEIVVTNNQMTVDAFEDDDSKATASPAVYGVSQSRSFTDDAYDWISFYGIEGCPYFFKSSITIYNADTVFYLYNSAGVQVAYNDDGGEGVASYLEYTPPSTGMYYLKIYSYGGAIGAGNLYNFEMDYHHVSENVPFTPETLYNHASANHAVYTSSTTNIAKRATVTGFSSQVSYDTAAEAINGTYGLGGDRWSTGQGNGTNQWLELDLGAYYYFDKWAVVNWNYVSPSSNSCNRMYGLQIMINGVWVDVSSVRNGFEEPISIINLSQQVVARKVKLIIYQGDRDSTVIIPEFALYNLRGYVPQPGDILLTEESTPDHAGLVYGLIDVPEYPGKAHIVKTIEAQGEGVAWRLMTKWTDSYGSFWVKRVKGATYSMALQVAELAKLQLGKGYNVGPDYDYPDEFYCTELVMYCWWQKSGVRLDSEDAIGWFDVEDLDDDGDAYQIYSL